MFWYLLIKTEIPSVVNISGVVLLDCILLFYEIIVILACEYVSVRNHIKYFFLNHAMGRNYYS